MKRDAADYLYHIQERLKLCGEKCARCHYPCTSRKNRENLEEKEEHIKEHQEHSCGRTNHQCNQNCKYCLSKKEPEKHRCALNGGHSEWHDCKRKGQDHTCGKDCHLKGKQKCDGKCTKDALHKGLCKCSAPDHLCNSECDISDCTAKCKEKHDTNHSTHKCKKTECSKRCTVKTLSNGVVETCVKRCQNGHSDHSQHICSGTHNCPKLCGVKGYCAVKKIKGSGDVAERKWCSKEIPSGKLSHDGTCHCSASIHTCYEKCELCGTYCNKQYDHSEKHDCAHSEMIHAKFFAADDSPEARQNRYNGYQELKSGASGSKEYCHMFCERLGRGHIHIQRCDPSNHRKEGIRHQTREYKPNPGTAKDEVKHSVFWSMRN